MSSSYTIHVRAASPVSTEEFVRDAAAAIGSELTRTEFGDGFEGSTPVGLIDVFTDVPQFDDEPGIPLSLYPWYIEMMKPKVDEDRNRRVLAALWTVYEALTHTGRYLCCFVYETTVLLATNDPAVTAVPVGDQKVR
jgi:hypothetical protein